MLPELCACGHAWRHHYDEGCCHHTVGRICSCTIPPQYTKETTVDYCQYCNHPLLTHTPFGNCLACVPGNPEHLCRAVLLREVVHPARDKYERLEVELGAARDELDVLKVLREDIRDHISLTRDRLEAVLEAIEQTYRKGTP